jgi:asparagine synthase (glutamine-hydrolysing)
MEFCWSIPRNQFRRDEQDRLLIRRAMAGHLPNEVRWNKRRGIQGADTGQRVVDHRDEIDSTLARLDRSELARHYLDLPRMRSVFDSVQQGIEYDNNHQSGSILLRGLMVGMFLLRFD